MTRTIERSRMARVWSTAALLLLDEGYEPDDLRQILAETIKDHVDTEDMMRRKMSVLADEVEEGDLVHHVAWSSAPDRVGEVERVQVGVTVVRLTIAGTATAMVVPVGDYVQVQR